MRKSKGGLRLSHVRSIRRGAALLASRRVTTRLYAQYARRKQAHGAWRTRKKLRHKSPPELPLEDVDPEKGHVEVELAFSVGVDEVHEVPKTGVELRKTAQIEVGRGTA